MKAATIIQLPADATDQQVGHFRDVLDKALKEDKPYIITTMEVKVHRTDGTIKVIKKKEEMKI